MAKKTMTGEEFQAAAKEAARLALDALTTDGAHHKQWYLERIIEALGLDLEHAREEFGFEKGIAP